eukprot:2779905-Rhodomonas_salina.4
MPLSDLPNLLCYEELLALQPGATLLLYAARGRLLLLGGRLVQTGCMLLQNWACAATSFAQPHTKPCISTNYDLAPYAMSQPIYSLSTHLPVPQSGCTALGYAAMLAVLTWASRCLQLAPHRREVLVEPR